MNIFLDLETLPTEDEEVIASIAADITHPSNMSKPETIAKWEEQEKPALVKSAVLKTAFDGSMGRILCIGSAFDNGDAVAVIDKDESFVLAKFMEQINGITPEHRLDQSAIFVGHNLSGFDLRFLWQRCVINKIPMSATLAFACRAKPWDKCVADTMLMWNPERDKRISLDRLCKALGVKTSKGDMDGSKVYETYLAGDLDKIAAYCMDDVIATRECYRRMMFQ